MAITVNTDMADVQILIDAVRGVFRGKNAFMGSILVSQGAVRVSGTMPQGGPGAIGKKIDIPYFGTIGEFTNNPDGSSVTPYKLAQMLEQATISRDSLAVEVSAWAQGLGQVDPALGDPFQESANQAMAAATRQMDKVMVDEYKTTPLVKDVYNASSPVFIDWDLVVDSKTLWGDEQDSIVAMVVHSQTHADMAKLKNSKGEPLLLMNQTQGQESVTRFCGVPVLVSDRVPLDGSTMTSPMGSAGSTPPQITLSGTPLGPWKLVIDIVTGGGAGTATFRFSTDGGNTWSDEYLTPSGGGPLVLDDSLTSTLTLASGTERPRDSLVGANGKTGITATFTNSTYNADNVYKSIANLNVTGLILQQDSGAFWYNAQRLGAKQDVDILADTDILAMHLYRAAKLYRRRRGGTRPGCVAIKHNVRGFVGGTTF